MNSDDKFSDIDTRLSKILKESFQTKEIGPEAKMDDIPEWDSLMHVRLIIAIEDEFNIAIDFVDTLEMASIPDIKNKIIKYLA